MAMHTSIMLIEGDHMSELTELFEDFEVTDTGKDIMCNNPDDMWKEVEFLPSDRQIERKAACFCKGWTVIIDPNIWMFTHDACLKLSSELSSRIFAIVCEGVSSSYGYVLYENGEQVRFFMSIEGETIEDSGTPLEIEVNIDKSDLFDDDMLLIMSLMGVSYDDIEAAESFVVKEVRSPELTPEEIAEFERFREEMEKKHPTKLTLVMGSGEYSKESRKKAVAKASKKKKRKWRFWG